MSLKKFLIKYKTTYKIYLYYNLFLKHKIHTKRSYYSQWGEDLEIQKFFKGKNNGFYLDIGCYHPTMYNNTCLLFNNGWRGMNIDLNQTSIDLFNIARPKDLNICTAISKHQKTIKYYHDHLFSPINTIDKNFYEMHKEINTNMEFREVQSNNINNILENYEISKKIDFINIDIEGVDLEVLEQIDLKKHKTDLLAIETHLISGAPSKDSKGIYDHLIKANFELFKRMGPTSLFKRI